MSKLDTKIRLFGVANDSIVDGPGLRYSIYVQGCSHHCKCCHNKGSWSFSGGTITTIKALINDIEQNKLIKNVTISGGDPFDQPKPVSVLASELKLRNYGIWAYSGYTYEQLVERAKTDIDIKNILHSIDVLVDGPFLEEQKSLELRWKGSKNQRIIDLNKTLIEGKIELWQDFSIDYKIPENW